MLNHLMQIEKARGFLEAAHLSNQWIRKMSRNAFLLETHHTTHIEGTQLTLDQSKRVLAGKDIPRANEKDVKEVKNYRDAFKLVSDYLKKETTIKESFIKGIHKELVKGVRGGSANPGDVPRSTELCGKLHNQRDYLYTSKTWRSSESYEGFCEMDQ